MTLLLAMVLAAAPATTCVWRTSAGVTCERRCDCAEVARRLDHACSELLRVHGVVPLALDRAIDGLRIEVEDTSLFSIDGRLAVGVTDGRRWVKTTRDMRSAFHELFHVIWFGLGRGLGHEAWDAMPDLRELDLRYQSEFRGRVP